ncbi:MAG: histidine phosphatase family protein [Alphaproteobacteria bacterium]|nr:histidine phosphatase family protein [Alphaproteobacteria bacterium]
MSSDPGATTRWWWVRHAPVKGAAGRYTGQRDVEADLSDQAALERIRGFLPRDAVLVTSPLIRARTTLLSLTADREVADGQPHVEPAFMEQNFGAWEGQTYAEVWDDLPADSWSSPGTIQPPGGESFTDMVERVTKAIDRITGKVPGRHVVSVAHAGVIRAALMHALKLQPNSALLFQLDTLSITCIDAYRPDPQSDTFWTVQFVNRL